MNDPLPWFGNGLTLTSHYLFSPHETFRGRINVSQVVYHSGYISPVRCGRSADSTDTYASHADRDTVFIAVCCTACLYRYPEFSRDFATT